MAANTSPRFWSALAVGFAQISTANANRDGTGTITDLVTGATEGSQVDRVRIKATGTTTAGMIRLFYYDGSTYRLIDEIPVSAITPSGTVEAFDYDYAPPIPIMLTSGKKLAVSTHNAETFNVWACGGSF